MPSHATCSLASRSRIRPASSACAASAAPSRVFAIALLATLILACGERPSAFPSGSALASLCAQRLATRSASGPPVLVVVLDTVRADRTALIDPALDTTPRLAALAESSLVFRNAASSGSWTLPAHASLFTGLYPYQHGVHWLQDQSGARELSGFAPAVRQEEEVLAEVFRDAGYCTVGVSPNYWLTEAMGFAQGFDRWMVFDRRTDDPRKQYVPGEHVVDAFLKELEPALPYPFFGFVNLMDAHAAYQPEPGYDRHSADVHARWASEHGSKPEPTPGTPRATNYWNGSIYTNGLRDLVNRDGGLPHEGVQEYLRALYDDELRYADAQLGRIVDFLRAHDRLDDTILVVVGDHGESFFVHGLVNHGIGVYEETIHVPMLIRNPARIEPGVVDERVEIIDLFPTLLALAGLADEAGDRERFGVDLLDPVARHAARASLAETYANPWERDTLRPELLRTTRAVVLDGWKRIEVSDGPGTAELYDLRSDPEERVDLADSPRAAEAPAALLEAFERLSGGRAAPTAAPTAMSAQDVEQLRALGYVDGG